VRHDLQRNRRSSPNSVRIGLIPNSRLAMEKRFESTQGKVAVETIVQGSHEWCTTADRINQVRWSGARRRRSR
jgi:hypothetical protein